ncbi:MAG: ABC transporter permease [Myxococcales bacterium]|nr:ABC transporter permease [Myxococcales bacterium]MCB9672485.1 ABC transporter permease [Alphaproteobacteria bacterium]MCB9691736.1 ABC transporter permease [Alphaproteobacteria bacterium]
MWMLFQLAWRNLWRQGRRSLITATAMSVAVAMCMAMIAFNDGMYGKLFNVMVEQQLGHVQVHHPDYPKAMLPYDTVPEATATLERIEALPDVVAAAARLNGAGLVGGKVQAMGAQLVGLDPRRDAAVTKADQQIVEGRFLAEAPAHEIVLGKGLAKEIDARVGDSVVIVTQAADGSMGNDVYDVVGFFSTGSAQMDKGGTMLHLTDLQELLALPGQVHGITVIGDDPDAVLTLKDHVKTVVPEGTEVLTWQEASPMAAQLMSTQTAGSAIFLGLVFTVASFGVLNTMLMSVFERTRELGVLKAIGMRPGRIVTLVVFESLLLAALAGGIGLVLGGFLDYLLVVYGLDVSSNGEGMSFQGVQLDPVMRGEVHASSIAMVVIALLIVSVVASLYPAFRASRLVPVEAMRVND